MLKLSSVLVALLAGSGIAAASPVAAQPMSRHSDTTAAIPAFKASARLPAGTKVTYHVNDGTKTSFTVDKDYTALRVSHLDPAPQIQAFVRTGENPQLTTVSRIEVQRPSDKKSISLTVRDFTNTGALTRKMVGHFGTTSESMVSVTSEAGLASVVGAVPSYGSGFSK